MISTGSQQDFFTKKRSLGKNARCESRRIQTYSFSSLKAVGNLIPTSVFTMKIFWGNITSSVTVVC